MVRRLSGVWLRRSAGPTPAGHFANKLGDAHVERVADAHLGIDSGEDASTGRRLDGQASWPRRNSYQRIWQAFFPIAPHRSETFKLTAIRCSSTRCAISSVCIWLLRNARWCYCRKRARTKPWTERTTFAYASRTDRTRHVTISPARNHYALLRPQCKSGELIGQTQRAIAR